MGKGVGSLSNYAVMEIRIQESPRRKALFVIDVQSKSLSPKALDLVPFMASFIAKTEYDVYVEANYWADENSMFFKQGGFSLSKEEAGTTAPELKQELQKKNLPQILVQKDTRSCFKALNAASLRNFLALHKIEEAHFIGFDINDCVLASAYDALDLGYFTCVIEELCHHWDGIDELKEAAITIYRRQKMTNYTPDGSGKVISV
jgi:nicotinamidase-related amidase